MHCWSQMGLRLVDARLLLTAPHGDGLQPSPALGEAGITLMAPSFQVLRAARRDGTVGKPALTTHIRVFKSSLWATMDLSTFFWVVLAKTVCVNCFHEQRRRLSVEEVEFSPSLEDKLIGGGQPWGH